MNLNYVLLEYCKKYIADWEFLEGRALSAIDKWRCPLRMACPELVSEMERCFAQYFDENDIEEPEDLDVEEVFWA